MGLIRKLRRILTKAFPPPAKVSLRYHHGIIGIITSARFRNMEMSDRQDLLEDVLRSHGLSKEEMMQIGIIVGVTPEEAEARAALDRI
jgi:hypothetical protein